MYYIRRTIDFLQEVFKMRKLKMKLKIVHYTNANLHHARMPATSAHSVPIASSPASHT